MSYDIKKDFKYESLIEYEKDYEKRLKFIGVLASAHMKYPRDIESWLGVLKQRGRKIS